MLNFDLIDKRIISKLHDMDWQKDKTKDITLMCKEMENEGFIPFKYALDILSHFQGVSISYSREELKMLNVKVNNYYGSIQFDALMASGLYDFVESRMNYLQENLFPIGFLNGQLMLCVGETERIYTFNPLEPIVLGENIIDFLNKILK
ncbi:MAG: SUKH-3 domain-containing protein [Lachnospira sp.]|nr:SUKH-3 domain-containing protein [Lachnospira sp.]MBP3380653.1 SUKH-3 domain-containing protein [Ruminococcus sp.]